MRTINPEHLEAVKRLLAETPYYSLLDMKVEEMGPGTCTISVNISDKHKNSYGGFCGGAYASLLDMGAYYALYCLLDEDQGYTTLDMSTHFLKAVSEGTVYCKGTVLRQGKTICLCESRVYDAEEHLLAECTAKMFVSPTVQPMSASVSFLEPGTVLPLKFLD